MEWNKDDLLTKAVIAQFGGQEDFEAAAHDVVRNGMASGFNGWIYHSETMGFVQANRKLILDYLEAEAGEELFTALSADEALSTTEFVRGIYEDDYEYADAAQNFLAWATAEEVCQAWVDLNE
jgi:hypothetical protein